MDWRALVVLAHMLAAFRWCSRAQGLVAVAIIALMVLGPD